MQTHPVQANATQPLPLHVVHAAGLAEQPVTSTLAQSTAVSYSMDSGEYDEASVER
jgi:hypothetical protein